MGQYYNAINIDTMEWLSPWDYEEGSKLMETAWVGNDYMGKVMSLMTEGGIWFKQPIVFCVFKKPEFKEVKFEFEE